MRFLYVYSCLPFSPGMRLLQLIQPRALLDSLPVQPRGRGVGIPPTYHQVGIPPTYHQVGLESQSRAF